MADAQATLFANLQSLGIKVMSRVSVNPVLLVTALLVHNSTHAKKTTVQKMQTVSLSNLLKRPPIIIVSAKPASRATDIFAFPILILAK